MRRPPAPRLVVALRRVAASRRSRARCPLDRPTPAECPESAILRAARSSEMPGRRRAGWGCRQPGRAPIPHPGKRPALADRDDSGHSPWRPAASRAPEPRVLASRVLVSPSPVPATPDCCSAGRPVLLPRQRAGSLRDGDRSQMDAPAAAACSSADALQARPQRPAGRGYPPDLASQPGRQAPSHSLRQASDKPCPGLRRPAKSRHPPGRRVALAQPRCHDRRRPGARQTARLCPAPGHCPAAMRARGSWRPPASAWHPPQPTRLMRAAPRWPRRPGSAPGCRGR